ncbi:hypothetical protein [Gemmatimonas sp.]|uniref:hypothetical protein n=1 Tax=Gemmatimonas sp. TaxID=1962908 RepID=UPI00334215B1
MIQVNSSSSPFAGSYTAPAGYGRPKRGTPDYAATMRAQIARLAALHAASVAEAAAVAQAVQTVLVVSSCAKVRGSIKASLQDSSWVRVIEASSVDAGLESLGQEAPDLMVVDYQDRAVLASPAAERAVLIADQVPRSGELPTQLVGLLARPLKPERVSRQLLGLLASVG